MSCTIARILYLEVCICGGNVIRLFLPKSQPISTILLVTKDLWFVFLFVWNVTTCFLRIYKAKNTYSVFSAYSLNSTIDSVRWRTKFWGQYVSLRNGNQNWVRCHQAKVHHNRGNLPPGTESRCEAGTNKRQEVVFQFGVWLTAGISSILWNA
jgi:hypothetical protein